MWLWQKIFQDIPPILEGDKNHYSILSLLWHCNLFVLFPQTNCLNICIEVHESLRWLVKWQPVPGTKSHNSGYKLHDHHIWPFWQVQACTLPFIYQDITVNSECSQKLRCADPLNLKWKLLWMLFFTGHSHNSRRSWGHECVCPKHTLLSWCSLLCTWSL